MTRDRIRRRGVERLAQRNTVAGGHDALDELRRFGIGNVRGATSVGVDRFERGGVQSRGAARGARGGPDAWIGELGLVHRSSILARRWVHARIADFRLSWCFADARFEVLSEHPEGSARRGG